MKAQVLAGLALTIQIFFPTAAFSDSQDDSKWASGRDPLADFCSSVTNSLSGFAKGLTGDSSSSGSGEGADWGTKRGGWDIAAPQNSNNQGISVIESSKKVTVSTNVSIKSVDGSRMIRRFGPNEKSQGTPLKKMIDSGSSSYSLGSYGASRYYPIGAGGGSGYRASGGSIRSGGAWGYNDAASNPYSGGYSSYGFGSGSNSGGRGFGRSVAGGAAGGGASRAF